MIGIDNKIIVGKCFHFLRLCSHHVLFEGLGCGISQAILAYAGIRNSSTVSTVLPISVIDEPLVNFYISSLKDKLCVHECVCVCVCV